MKNTKTRLLATVRRLILAAVITFMTTATIAPAATIFESGTLGPTGITFSDLGNTVPGTNLTDAVFAGVRFNLGQPVLTSQIGGHFVASTHGTFFGAIVKLDDENDFPDSGDLSTSDVLGHALLNFPVPSAEVFADLSLSLEPAWYALVFGSDLFGANANGGAVRNGSDIGDPLYIGYQPGASASGWFNFFGLPLPFDNHRFVINGSIVPEPSSSVLFFIASLLFLLKSDATIHNPHDICIQAINHRYH